MQKETVQKKIFLTENKILKKEKKGKKGKKDGHPRLEILGHI